MRVLAIFLAVSVAAAIPSLALPIPNRGKQLFIAIKGRRLGNTLVAMTPDSRSVIREWCEDNPTYDFISAVVRHRTDGCQVTFTRHVMKDDYIPRVEHLDLSFPYAQQPLYRFFEDGAWIQGFYRNSVKDIGPKESMPGPDDLPLPPSFHSPRHT